MNPHRKISFQNPISSVLGKRERAEPRKLFSDSPQKKTRFEFQHQIALHYKIQTAIRENDLNFLKECLNEKVDFDYNAPNTPLKIAVEQRNLECVKILLDAGALTERLKESSGNPLPIAAQNGDLELVRALVSAGAQVNTKYKGCEALYSAAENGHCHVLAFLLEAGAELEVPSLKGETALYKAVTKGHYNCAEFLLKAGASPNVCRLAGFHRESMSPLHKAVRYGRVDLVELLLHFAANPNPTTSVQLETPLHQMLSQSQHSDEIDFEILKLFLKFGADVNLRNNDGFSALHFALCNYKSINILQLLINADADVNAQTNAGFTPLHFILDDAEDRLEAFQLIFAAGADDELENRDGKSPLDFAVENGKIIEQHIMRDARLQKKMMIMLSAYEQSQNLARPIESAPLINLSQIQEVGVFEDILSFDPDTYLHYLVSDSDDDALE